jgi:ketosteroid isomerase-like protein
MEQLEKIISEYITAYNNFDIEAMTAHMHPEIVFENISSGGMSARTVGLEQFKQLACKSMHLFHERNQQVTGINISGDTAEVDLVYTAVLAFDLSDELPANEQIHLKGRSVFRFKEGRIIELKDIS